MTSRFKQTNLNRVHPSVPLSESAEWDFAKSVTSSGEITAYFRDLENNLVDLINQYPASAGCVAWLTSVPILSALARQQQTTIIVQKEDFLRPDGATNKKHLRLLYSKLEGGERYTFSKLCNLSVCGDPTIEGVRCVGNHNSDRNPACPRMHNKFLILGQLEKGEVSHYCFVPELVWTGSFNFTYNAGLSLENALVISNSEIVSAYYSYWQDIAAISEPLDWESEWVEPEWRIGT